MLSCLRGWLKKYWQDSQQVQDKHWSCWQPCPVKSRSAHLLQKKLEASFSTTAHLTQILAELERISYLKSAPPGHCSRFSCRANLDSVVKNNSHYQVRLPWLQNDFYRNEPKGLVPIPSKNIEKHQYIDSEDREPDYMVTMVEPSTCPTMYDPKLQLSNLELALMSEDQASDLAVQYQLDNSYRKWLLKQKKKVDHFYGSRIVLPLKIKRFNDKEEEWIVTLSTAPYFSSHMIFMSSVCRQDIHAIKAKYSSKVKKKQKNREAIYRACEYRPISRRPFLPLPGQKYVSKTTDDICPKWTLHLGCIQSALQDIHNSLDANKYKTNETDIEALSRLLSKLDHGAIIAQNSPDACASPNHLHYHYTVEEKEYVLPIFKTKVVAIKTTSISRDVIYFGKLVDYPGSVYKITIKHLNDTTIKFLKSAVGDFLKSAENTESVMTIIARKNKNSCEYYFTLRKDFRKYSDIADRQRKQEIYPGNQSKNIPKQTNRTAGWVECAGAVLVRYPEVAETYTDQMHEALLNWQAADESQCALFESCVINVMKCFSPRLCNQCTR